MGLKEAIKSAFQNLHENWRIIPLLWFLNIIFALLILSPFSKLIVHVIGDNPNVDEYLSAFNYPFLTELQNNFGDLLSWALEQSIGSILLFFLLGIFITGGILQFIKNGVFSSNDFIKGSFSFLPKLLWLTVVFLIIHVLLLLLFWLLFTAGDMNILQIGEDLDYIYRLSWVGPIYLILAIFTSILHDFAKIHLIHNAKNWLWQPIQKAFIFIIKHPLPILILFLVFQLLIILIIFANNWFLKQWNSLLLLAFIFSQFFILLRVAMKVFTLLSYNELVKDK